jgi:hypothetical protein
MSNANIERAVLPIPDRAKVGLITYDARDPNTKFPPIEPLRPPKGAPNVLIILLDDVELLTLNGVAGIETPEFLTERIDKFGSPDAYLR